MTGSEPDYRRFYDLEGYLFDTVRERFHREGRLGAFDFFCIVAWKANRAKSKVARRLLSSSHRTLDEAVQALTEEVARAPTSRDRLRVLVEGWKFRMPMATAILTVLYPNEFTVCDTRVAAVVGEKVPEMHGNFDTLWEQFRSFRAKVEQCAPAALSLRDKDRYLWGRSFHQQLVADLKDWESGSEGAPADEMCIRCEESSL